MINRKRNAFTLIELLVVVSIIALLVSILLPALGKARDAAKAAVCAHNLKQISLGSFMYRQNYDDRYINAPGYDENGVDQGWWSLIKKYVGDNDEVMECPKQHYGPLWGVEKWSYGFNQTFDRMRGSDLDAESVVFADAHWHFGSYAYSMWASGSGVPQIAWNRADLYDDEEQAILHRVHNNNPNILFNGGHVERANWDQLRDSMFEVPDGVVKAWLE